MLPFPTSCSSAAFRTNRALHCTLHCNHISGHLKTEHTESIFLLRRHLGNWPRSKHEKRTDGSAWETWTVAAADGVGCARVRWEINFLLTFETAPFFCVYLVYKAKVEVERTDLLSRDRRAGYGSRRGYKPSNSPLLYRNVNVTRFSFDTAVGKSLPNKQVMKRHNFD